VRTSLGPGAFANDLDEKYELKGRMSMKKFVVTMMAVFFGLSLGLYGQSTDQEPQNLQKKEQHQNRVRNEKGNTTAGQKVRTEQSNQGQESQIKNQNRERVRKEAKKQAKKQARKQAKADAKQTMKAERAQSKSGR